MIRNSFFFFSALALFAIAGFWPTYYSRPHEETDWHVHLHGIVMSLWIAMLISQAWLIRSNNRLLHRRLGKASYFLAPAVVFATLSLAHVRLERAGPAPAPDLLYFFYVQASLLAMFVLAWTLGILNRHAPHVHARYMACTALTLVDPVFARLLYSHAGVEPPFMQLATYLLVDTILMALIAWDLRNDRRPIVFPAMLAAFVVAQIPTFFAASSIGWRSFAVWYGGLPLP
jgi:hypothetical protein